MYLNFALRYGFTTRSALEYNIVNPFTSCVANIYMYIYKFSPHYLSDYNITDVDILHVERYRWLASSPGTPSSRVYYTCIIVYTRESGYARLNLSWRK